MFGVVGLRALGFQASGLGLGVWALRFGPEGLGVQGLGFGLGHKPRKNPKEQSPSHPSRSRNPRNRDVDNPSNYIAG